MKAAFEKVYRKIGINFPSKFFHIENSGILIII
jgi:hypothetical protein